MTLLCITNEMNDVRSCTLKDVHRVTCDGNAYAWNERHNRMETTGKTCKGCLPREARHGLLCWGCWERVEKGVKDWPNWADKIAAAGDRAVQRDNGGISSASEGYVPIPGTSLAWDEITSYLRSLGTSVDAWVSNTQGATDSVRFARAVASAIRTHAVEETAHKVNRTRCPKCNTLALLWTPPERLGDQVTVKCRNCGHALKQESFEAIALIEKPGKAQPANRMMDAGAPLNVDKNLAEPFDPNNPEHAELIA